MLKARCHTSVAPRIGMPLSASICGECTRRHHTELQLNSHDNIGIAVCVPTTHFGAHGAHAGGQAYTDAVIARPRSCSRAEIKLVFLL
jgi:hypothetical protein